MKNIHSYQISCLMKKKWGCHGEQNIWRYIYLLWHLATSLRDLQYFLYIVNIRMKALNIHTKFHVSWLKNDSDMIRFRIKMRARAENLEWGVVRVNFQDMATIFFLEWFSIAKASSAKCQLISIFKAPSYYDLLFQ